MMLKIAAAIVLAAGVAHASEPVVPFRGESTVSFQCRSTYIPQARQCMSRCDVGFAVDADEGLRFECMQACTSQGLYAIGECRRVGAATGAALARR
jgi:hypothetical protein